MDREDALAYIKPLADAIFEMVGKDVEDTETGYGPAIDSALALLSVPEDEFSTPDIPASRSAAFRAALRYSALDLAEWAALPLVDNQVDGPLTNVKLSQLRKNIEVMKQRALSDLLNLGIGPSDVSLVRWTFDYLEQPADVRVTG